MRERNELTWWRVWVVAVVLACVVLTCAVSSTAQTIPGPPVDPLTIADDDFGRHRSPAEWRDLEVRRIVFSEDGATWRVWRIANMRKPAGPLWVVLHDNENATFEAGLEAVRSWGGVMMVVDTDPFGTDYGARFNRAVTRGAPIDPNRNFLEALPRYDTTMLADLGAEPRPIIALHTNAYGYDRALSNCATTPYTGSGEISVRLCNAKHTPRAAIVPRWPFDDGDTLALLPYLRGADRGAGGAFCGKRLAARDFNLVFEAVDRSDGSLSNYAAQHGLRYINLETRERGYDPQNLAAARDRLVAMIDMVMRDCIDLPRVALTVRR